MTDSPTLLPILRSLAINPAVPEVEDTTGYKWPADGDFGVCGYCHYGTGMYATNQQGRTVEVEFSADHYDDCPIVLARVALEGAGMGRRDRGVADRPARRVPRADPDVEQKAPAADPLPF